MKSKTKLINELIGVLRSLEDQRIDLLLFRKAARELQIRISQNKVPYFSSKKRSSGNEGPPHNAQQRDGITPYASKSGIRLMILRSPGVGNWSTSPESENADRTMEKGACIGSVCTLLDDEPLTAPCRGKIEKWLVAEGEAVGFDTPLALWEVV